MLYYFSESKSTLEKNFFWHFSKFRKQNAGMRSSDVWMGLAPISDFRNLELSFLPEIMF